MPVGVRPLVAAATAARVASSSGVSFGGAGGTDVPAGGADVPAGGTIGGVGVVVGGRVHPGDTSCFGSGVYGAVPGGGGSIHPGGGTTGGAGVGSGAGIGAEYLNTGLERLDSWG